MLHYQVRLSSPYEAPDTPYLATIDAKHGVEDSNPEEHSLHELQSLANTANNQYLDLESAESELAAWIRNANRGPHAPPSNSSGYTPAPPPPTPSWDFLYHSHAQQSLHSLTMFEQPESQYAYHQDPSQDQSFFPPPQSESHSPVQPYYQSHPHIYPPTLSDPNDSNSSHSTAYAYPSQYPSPSAALSPSPSSTDPELKRIRNTAASARFRAKKKRREASLERNAKEKRETLERLEQRIRELESENQFLKGLIFDKAKLDGVKTELDRARELKKDLLMESGEGERDDGVGTGT